MDVLNVISWLKSKRLVTTVDASQTLIPLGLRDSRRDDGYLPGVISVADLLAGSSSLPDFIEYNETDKTLWNNGQGNNSSNLSYGESALINNSTGYANTAIGQDSLVSNTIGNWNTAVGNTALLNNTTGILNTAIGTESLTNNTTGFRNTALGMQALNSNTIGTKNTALGTESLTSNLTGIENTAVGDGTYNGQTGARNVLIGFQAAANNFDECVVLGRSAAATASNQFVVGSAAYNAGAITTEALIPTISWAVRINGVDYKIPLQVA